MPTISSDMILLSLDLALLTLCALAAVIDWRHGILPNGCNAGIAALGLAASMVSGADIVWRIVDAGTVIVLLLLLRLAYRRLRGQTGLGLGDVKFLGAATLRLGLAGLNILVLAACLSGLAEIALRRMRGEQLTRRSALRFGPHLAIGFALALMLERAAAAGW
ncbi:leader peptidase (prepilin peptidase) / N-methyltransferase [Rhizobium sp. RU20A]|uniref:prepilin peptidase n=1 Tax=Rhizobium sp. RU20A TaxID=1907412 RepID=UPI0009574DFF|nr:A24 family peptidase [Rhizobium sp. RU20A]SIQ86536.1 leader peptidase (prepilin peptidase) / N-methyltransferase [Rhizobium sp. RU20A]